MLTKSAPMQIKAVDDEAGTFEAIVSVFNNVDTYGDVVMPGAFADTLAEWKASGDPIPVLWAHMSHDPDFHIGAVVDAKETDEGLYVKGRIDLDGSPKAKQVHRLLKGRRVTQFSFAYDVREAAFAEREGKAVYELRKLGLYEVGPCLVGVNQETRLIGAKSDDHAATAALAQMSRLVAEIKAGRELPPEIVARVRDATNVLGEALPAEVSKSALDTTTAHEPVKDEADEVGKSEEPMRDAPVDLSELEAIEIDAMLADL